MWINGIDYQLVEKGTIENTFLFGIIIGLTLVGVLMLLYQQGKRNMFRKYYRQINDAELRKNMMTSIQDLADEVDDMAEKTNTLFFKNMANEFNSLIAWLTKRD